MTARVSGPVKSYPNNSALAPYLRVKLSAGYLVVAGAGDDELGILEGRTFATDTVGAVRSLLLGETVRMVAAGAVSQYADVYRAASGKISATPNGKRIGIAMEAASADGSQIEVLPLKADAQAMLVEAHTADDTLLAAEMYGSVHTNTGAAATITLGLPAAVIGMNAKFALGAAQQLRLDPNSTETISLPSTGVPGAAGKYLMADAIGETVELVCCSAGSWRVFGYTGTWTAEA
jgi:hypothetical protein